MQRYWPVIFFPCNVLVWFWYQDNASLIKQCWKCLILFYFLEEFEKNGYKIQVLYMFDRIPQWRHLAWTSVCKEFLSHIFYFSSSDQFVQITFLLYSTLADCMFLETCPSDLDFSFLEYVTVHIFLWYFVFWSIGCYFSSLISYFVYLVISFFLWQSLAKGFSVLFIFPKNQLLVL